MRYVFILCDLWVLWLFDTPMEIIKEDSRTARRGQGARLLGPAERSERRYLRNYDDLDDDIAHGGGASGGGGGFGGAGKVPSPS